MVLYCFKLSDMVLNGSKWFRTRARRRYEVLESVAATVLAGNPIPFSF
jgi:hypothetical protein